MCNIEKVTMMIKAAHVRSISIAAAVMTVIVCGLAFFAQRSNMSSVGNQIRTDSTQPASEDVVNNSNTKVTHSAPLDPTLISINPTTTKSLTYILEEEKLAHDVYQVMYDKWGLRVFGNILRSETSHQNAVLAVIQSRSATDPRSHELGVFKNPDLQSLYNKLISQGTQNTTEALKVGVAIEELDIADLRAALSFLDPVDTDVAATYESLLSGSQRHLSAFNRQLSR